MTNPKIENLPVTPQSTILDCLQKLQETGTHVIVCVEAGKMVGVISDGDIRRGLLNGAQLDSPIGPLVTACPVTIQRPYSVGKVIALMRQHRIDAMPIVDENSNFVDMLTLRSLLKATELPNHAIIMAGGLGTRLHPLTLDTPKPLLPLAERPIIEHIIGHLAKEGIRRVLITTHYLADKFPEVLGDGSHLDVNIEYLRERQMLGTAGGLRLIPQEARTEPFIVTNGDILWRLDIPALIKHHKESGAAVTVCVKEYSQTVPYGVVRIGNGFVEDLDEKPEHTALINAGIYCIDPEVPSLLPPEGPMDFPDFIRLLIKQGHKVATFAFDEYWRDIGNIEDYSHAIAEHRNSALTKLLT